MAETVADDETIQKIPNDIILDLITHLRLPLKHVIWYGILNKYFYNYIVRDHALLSLSSTSTTSPIIFHQSSRYRFTVTNSPVRKSVTLPNAVTILDSCNGILFLYCTWSRKYYLFNPLTSGILFLNDDNIPSSHWEGLALTVDVVPPNPSSSSFDFKLVELRTEHSLPLSKTSIRLGVFTRMRFGVFVPTRGERNLAKKYSYLDYKGSFAPSSYKPVYAYGCFHWLDADAKAIAAFDMETERPHIMDGPLVNIGTRYDTDALGPDHIRATWFGLARGALRFIRVDWDTVTVHSHDYVTEEWRVAYTIGIGDYMWGTPVRRRVPVFFDGGNNVFFHRPKKGSEKGGNCEEICVLDLSSGKWRTSIGEVEDCYGRCYREFVPTWARVSDVYMSSEMSDELRSTLVGLQRLLLDRA